MARRRRTTAGLVLVSAVALAASAGSASAQVTDGAGGTSTVTATLTANQIGSRSVTSVAPVALATTLGTSTLSGELAATVTEAARTGTNSWSLTAAIGSLTSGANSLANSTMSISNREVVQVAGGGTADGIDGTQDMSAARTLFTTTGQSTSAVYTGTYAATADLSLTVPNGQAVGVYTGTLTITLI